MTILLSSPSTASGRGDNGVVRVLPRNRCSHSIGMSSPPPFVVDYEWVRDDVLKYQSLKTFVMSVATLWRQLDLANPRDSCKMTVQAYEKNEFPFMRAVPGFPPFFNLTLPLNSFQCALLEHLNIAPSQLHPNNWAMVKGF